MKRAWHLLAGAAAIAVAALPGAALAVPDAGKSEGKGKANGARSHNLMHPVAKKQYAAKQIALQQKIEGKISANAKVAKVGDGPRGQFVDLALEGTDRIFTIIVEFGNERYPHPFFQDTDADGKPASDAQRFDGPLHNEIPKPDRKVDNTTIWKTDFNKAHYEDMYFNRMKKYYEAQSSGRYSIEGEVNGWVKVPFNQALYGRDYCGSITCPTSRALVRDALAVWVQQRLDGGQTIAEVRDYLKTFDKQDRYDGDGDGNFDEPDGFVDHFQIVHAGGDQAAGDPIYGTDAIWSHRSYANLQAGAPYPGVGVNVGSRGGLVSSNLVPNNPTGMWVGDYTIQPENGGLGVFAHEFAHDLGLPDLYDTSGNTGGAENSTGFWDLMSSGANIGDGGETIGDAPTNMSAWDKFQLGWLNYEVARAGQKSVHKLTPVGVNTKQAQAAIVVLPPSQNPKDLALGAPTSPTHAWYSTAGNNIDVNMTRAIALPTGGPISLSMQAWYEIEGCWDYAQLRVSTNAGQSWTPVTTNVSTDADENHQNPGKGITGISGKATVCDEASGSPAWVPVTADLSAYAGQTITLQVRYWTDPFVQGRGFEFDDLVITGPAGTVFSENAESAPNGWTLAGFRTTTGAEKSYAPHYYIAEYRPHRDYDASLATAYNFGFLNTKENWVEHFRYDPGVVIWYWDLHFSDNNVGDHPGEGEALPVDAHPEFDHWADGTLMRARIATRDSAFGVTPTSATTLNVNGVPTTIPSKPAAPLFNDLLDWWSADDGHLGADGKHVGRHQPGWLSVNVPKTGTTIRVQGISDNGFFAQIQVAPAK